MEWQSIRTAPRPGRDHPNSGGKDPAEWVLVWNGHHIGVAYFQTQDDDAIWWGEDAEPVDPGPTHWMPLPKPPSD